MVNNSKPSSFSIKPYLHVIRHLSGLEFYEIFVWKGQQLLLKP